MPTKQDNKKLLALVEDSSGVAILEFASVAPFLVLLIITTFDIGLALDRYLSLTRIAYEGARFGAAYPALEEGTFSEQTLADPNVRADNQQALHRRIQRLLTRNNFNVNQATIETAREPGDNTIAVSISIPHGSFLTTFRELQLSVQVEAPYLFHNL